MTTIKVNVRGELTTAVSDLPEIAHQQIVSALTIMNEEREKQASLKIFGWWDLPETVALWRIDRTRGSGSDVLCMPRGFAASLAAGLSGLGIGIEWLDQRSISPASEGYFKEFVLRDYQVHAAGSMLGAQQGMLMAAAGSGKTVIALGMMAQAKQRTLVIVDKAGLVEQWRARAARFFEFTTLTDEDGKSYVPLEGPRTPGKIGGGTWEERDLTIALRQTLHERAWQLDATGWWEKWGMTIFDEAHHLSAETLGDLSRKTSSFFIFGMSATPSKSVMKGAIVHALVGPLVHRVPKTVLYEREILVQPIVEDCSGDFFTAFHQDHDATYHAESKCYRCHMAGCNKKVRHSHRNNYSSVLKKLVEDSRRNERIAARVMQERGHKHLVASSQLKHLDLIKKALVAAGWPTDRIWMLRGAENAKGLDQIIVQEVMDADEAVVLSTVAGEALDIPPIDRLHITFPMRDAGATIQLVGRVERGYPGKSDAVVVDYREPLVNVLDLQWMERSRTYLMQGLQIVEPDVDEKVVTKQIGEIGENCRDYADCGDGGRN